MGWNDRQYQLNYIKEYCKYWRKLNPKYNKYWREKHPYYGKGEYHKEWIEKHPDYYKNYMKKWYRLQRIKKIAIKKHLTKSKS